MKKNLFTTTFQLSISALALIFAISSCTKNRSETAKTPEPEQAVSAKASNAAPPPTVSLKVTVNNAGNKITNDGLGDYVNGSQSVKAVFDKYGNFIFSPNTNPNKAPVRLLNYDFSDPITIYTPPPPFGSPNYFALSTDPSTVISGFIPIQNLANSQSECVSFRTLGGGGTNTIGWRLIYHAGFDDRADSTTAFAYVTRISSTQWTFTSLGSCLPAAVPNKAALRSGDAQTLYGYYNMPFSFTLTKL